MRKTPTRFSPTIRSWNACVRQALISLAARSQSTAKRCEFHPPCSAAATSRARWCCRSEFGLIAPRPNRGSVNFPSRSIQSRHPMTLRISGKSINVGEALRGRVTERTEEVLRKYFDGNYSGHITVSKDGFGFRTDCALHLDSGITLEADSNATDAYASADQALLMIEKRLRRYKSRLKDRSARKAHAASEALAALDATAYVLEAPGEGDDDEEVTGYSPVI